MTRGREGSGEPHRSNSGEAPSRLSRALVAALSLLAAIAPGSGLASVPDGPRLAVVAQGYGKEVITKEVITIGPLGEAMRRLTDPGLIGVGDRPSWSADGSRLAFTAWVPNMDDPMVGVVSADGNDLRTYPRAFLNAGEPVMAPDGHSVAFARAQLVKVLPGRENYLFKSSIWSLDVEDGSVRRLTRWRLVDFLLPSSFSPDGSTLAATSYGHPGFWAVEVDLRSGRTSPLAREAMEPVYSPDGSSFAFVRWKTWRLSGVDESVPTIDELRVGRVGDLTETRLVLRRRGLSYMAWPSWDPSGSRLAFTLSQADEPGDRDPEEGNRVMAINADGTCLRKVFSDPELILGGAAWQPGPGREAGPIGCVSG